MPIFDVKCSVCGRVYEIITSHDAIKTMDCSYCDATFCMSLVPSKPAMFVIEGSCAANGYESQGNIPDDHYDPRVGQTSWDA